MLYKLKGEKNALSSVVHKVPSGVLCSLLSLLVVCTKAVCVCDKIYMEMSIFYVKKSLFVTGQHSENRSFLQTLNVNFS
jgi:hypothetical protein